MSVASQANADLVKLTYIWMDPCIFTSPVSYLLVVLKERIPRLQRVPEEVSLHLSFGHVKLDLSDLWGRCVEYQCWECCTEES